MKKILALCAAIVSLHLLPHMIFLSAHYCCPGNARLWIASRTKSLSFVTHDCLSFPEPLLTAIVSEDEQPETIKGVDHYSCCEVG